MNRFFLVLFLLGSFLFSGCMTHYVNFRTVSSGSHSTLDGGRVSYSRVESYSYDSGVYGWEHPRYYPNSLPVVYAPVSVRTRYYHPIHRGGYHRRLGGYNSSPVYVTPAPSAESLRRLLP